MVCAASLSPASARAAWRCAYQQQLRDQVLAWVARYRNDPALRMWGLGNEVLHKIVHPALVGPQDPEGVNRNFGLTDDGVPVDGQSLDMLSSLFHATP